VPVHFEFTASARRDKERLPAQDIPRLETALAAIAADPLIGKALQGEFAGLRSFRFRRYRIVYEFRAKEARVIILRIGHRREAYR
jgi:mRNA-degrading endonuclease RelE of RelBE toxin-antitoxin system